MNFIDLIVLVIKPTERFGKLANIFADLPTKNKLDDTGVFKALVGEDFLTVERKNRDPFSFMSKAQLLFSCSTIPRTTMIGPWDSTVV